MSKLTTVIGILVGAGVGFAAGYFTAKRNLYTQEDLDSVKMAYDGRMEELTIQALEKEEALEAMKRERREAEAISAANQSAPVKPELNEYRKVLEQARRVVAPTPGEPAYPEVIPEGSFGENQEYKKIVLEYYSDGVLAYTDQDDPIQDNQVSELIGDALRRFGTDGVVYVRNDALRAYYEVYKNDYPFYEG